MKRIYLKWGSMTVFILVGVTLFAMASLFCVYLWSLQNWKDLKIPFKLKKQHTFSVSEMMGSTNVTEVVKPNVSTIYIEPANPSLKEDFLGKGRKRPFAVIVVTSMAKFFNQRHSIRTTWYNWADRFNIRIFFMIGFQGPRNKLFQILEEEQRRHNDLIIDDYEEGYYKLPGKVLRMMKWYNATYTYENAPRFFVKTDQDVFINLPKLVVSLKNTSYYKSLESLAGCRTKLNGNSETESSFYPNYNEIASGFTTECYIPDEINLPFDEINPESYFIGGNRFENPLVETDPGSKWYIDSEEREKLNWPSTHFPTYVNGPCYVLSGNVVKPIYEASFTVPLFPFEDVYIVGMVAYDRLNLYISNIEGMVLNRHYICLANKRSKLNKLTAFHPVDHPFIMRKLCSRINSCITKSGSSRTRFQTVSVMWIFFSHLVLFKIKLY